MAALQDELQPLLARYEAEKGAVDEQQRLQNKVRWRWRGVAWRGSAVALSDRAGRRSDPPNHHLPQSTIPPQSPLTLHPPPKRNATQLRCWSCSARSPWPSGTVTWGWWRTCATTPCPRCSTGWRR